MRIPGWVQPVLAGLMAATAGAVLFVGCTSTVDGTPVAGPTDLGLPTAKPGGPHPPAVPSPAPTVPGPGGAIALPPNDNGYVFIETKSGKTRCQISADDVGCEAEFANSPIQDGQHANGVNINSDGTVAWVLGNLGAMNVVTLDYLTYTAQGWTIAASIDGTRFTNDGTGHGMFVSIDNVETF